jgi:hypothetical protein
MTRAVKCTEALDFIGISADIDLGQLLLGVCFLN